jgi:sorting nexin-29
MLCVLNENRMMENVQKHNNCNGTIFYKSVQLLAYADDTDIMAKSQSSLKEAFLALEGEERMELGINQEKTIHMITSQNAKQCGNKTLG